MCRFSPFAPFALSLALFSCGLPAPTEDQAPRLVEEAGHALDDIPLVTRLRLVGVDPRVPTDLWLVEGEISSTSAKRLRQGDVPKTVEDHRLPLSTWRKNQDLLLQPAVVLDPETTYTLVALGIGPIASFATVGEDSSVWRRWGQGDVQAGGWLVYCAVSPPEVRGWVGLERAVDGGESVTLGPGAWDASVHTALFPDGEHEGPCLKLRVPEQAVEFVVPPPHVRGQLLDPQPVVVVEPSVGAQSQQLQPSTDEPAQPGDDCLPLKGEGTGCFRVVGASVVVSSPPGVTAIAIETDGQTPKTLMVQDDSAFSAALGPLEAHAQYRMHWFHLAQGGAVITARAEFSTGKGAAQFVVNEVLANPSGPEPDAEWVEVLNIGNRSGSLQDYWLRDSGGEIALPAVSLAPGEYGVIVSSDYLPRPEIDPVPHPEAKPVVVPELAAAGLRNSGEAVALVDPYGVEVSKVPPLSAQEGVSVARRHPLSSDSAASFASHAEPGSSPGESNTLEAAEP